MVTDILPGVFLICLRIKFFTVYRPGGASEKPNKLQKFRWYASDVYSG